MILNLGGLGGGEGGGGGLAWEYYFVVSSPRHKTRWLVQHSPMVASAELMKVSRNSMELPVDIKVPIDNDYIVYITFTCDFFQVRVVIKSLPNLVQRNVPQTTGPCAELIIKHTKTAVFSPLPSVHCPRKTVAHFACNIMDRVVRLRRQNLAPGGRTAKW